MGETGKRSRRDTTNDDRYQKKRVITESRKDDYDDKYQNRRSSSRRDSDYDRKDDDYDDRYEKKRVSNICSRRDDENDDRYHTRNVNTSRSGNPDGKDNAGDGELVVYRILCPSTVIGSVIGKNGKVINGLRQETHSKIKIVDHFPGASERVILVYCHVKYKDDKEAIEDYGRPLCPAQDALLRVHATISDMVSNIEDAGKRHKDEARILVPVSQVANIIGKSGNTISTLRKKTRANIKIIRKDPNDPTHSCALSFDNFIEITGDSGVVKKALFAISAIMYKFSPKEEVPLDTTVPELPSSIAIPSDVPSYPTSGFYPSVEPVVPTSRTAPPVMSTSHFPEARGYSESGVSWPVYSSPLPPVSGHGSSSHSTELKVRVLCPSGRIGIVIGKEGTTIKNVRQESGARVDVEKLRNGCDECIITVASTESTDDVKSAAVEAVLMLQEKINDNDYDDSVRIHMLVPSRSIGCIIGKSGSIVKDMCKRTKADIHISRVEKPKCADEEDEFVQVIGRVRSVRDALVQIVLRLRDAVLKSKEGSRDAPSGEPPQPSLYAVDRSLPPPIFPAAPPLTTYERKSIPPLSPSAYDQRVETRSGGSGMHSTSSLYGFGSLQAVENEYGFDRSYLSKPFGGFSSTLEVVIPSSAVSKVMGKGGGNLENIRKISGAVVEVVDSHSSRSDRIALISGTPEQKRSAENLIQAFILST